MPKRTLVFTTQASLRLEQGNLMVLKKDGGTSSNPINDVGIVVLESDQILVTTALLRALMEAKVGVIVCDSQHHPTGMMMPNAGHTLLSSRYKEQIETSLPLKKNLWMQTIKAKLANQAHVLQLNQKPHQALVRWSDEVKSGDTLNLEARGAAYYWKHLLGSEDPDWTRDRYGAHPNGALNYGYAILRAAVARAIVCAGLIPALGLHHRNQYNPFCLADDLMEPYRPWVDKLVMEMNVEEDGDENDIMGGITKNQKVKLLEVLGHDCYFPSGRSPLMVALEKTTVSLANCYAGESKKIMYPTLHATK